MANDRIKILFTYFRRILRACAAPAMVLIPIAATMVLARILAHEASDWFSVYGNPDWSTFGDALPILVLFILALHFRSRWLAAAATAWAYAWLVLRIFALVLYRKALMGLELYDLQMLWKHTDAYALNAVLGDNYLLWLIPAVLAALAAICGAVWLTGRTIRDVGRRAMIVWRCFFWIFLLFSIIATVRFSTIRANYAQEDIYTGHMVRPLPVTAVFLIRDALPTRDGGAVPLNDSNRKVLEEMKIIPSADEQSAAAAPARFDRIVIVALESVDLEFIRALNPKMPEGVTPTLDRLVAEYPAMTNFFCASQPTSWGLTGLLMSRFDYTREVTSPERRASLFSIANGLGYRSCYFSPLTGVFADNRRTYGKIFAPERMYFLEDWTRKYDLRRDAPWGLSDGELYSGVLKILRAECGRRFVVLISTMDTHSPYTAIGISDADKKRFPTPFLQALHMTDRNLGEFLRELMADKTLYDDRTLIVITADHTATHGENYLHRKEYVPERVPLIFITPDRTVFDALDRKKYASGIDLAPTLVELIGGKAPASFMGRSLFSDKGTAISCKQKIFVRSPKGECRISPQGRSSDPEKQAIIDFIRSRY